MHEGQVSIYIPHHIFLDDLLRLKFKCFVSGSRLHSTSCQVQSQSLGGFTVHSGWSEVKRRIHYFTKLYALSQRMLHISDFVMNFGINDFCCDLCLLKRHSAGDTKVPFCLQSCVKPLEYAIAVHQHGTEHVHHFVGKEPSGLKFNMLSLDDDGGHKINATSLIIITECSCTRKANITDNRNYYQSANGSCYLSCWTHLYFWINMSSCCITTHTTPLISFIINQKWSEEVFFLF